MQQKKIIFLLAAFICFNTQYIFSQIKTGANGETSGYLKKFRSDNIKAMLDGKPEMIHAYYADDLRLMTEFQKTVMGKDNALLYYKAFFSRFTIKSYTRTEMEILDMGERVVEHGMFVMKIESKSLQKEHELKGNYLNIWKRLENAQLTLITDGWDYSHPVDMGEQLRFYEVPSVDVAQQAHLPINSNISFELAALNSLLETTITEHDAKIWSKFYTDDAIIFSRRHGSYEGRKAIDEHLENHVRELPVFEKLDLRNDRIDDLGQYVIEYASNLAVWRGGEYSGVGTGKDVRIWRREPGGPLKIFRHIGMYD